MARWAVWLVASTRSCTIGRASLGEQVKAIGVVDAQLEQVEAQADPAPPVSIQAHQVARGQVLISS